MPCCNFFANSKTDSEDYRSSNKGAGSDSGKNNPDVTNFKPMKAQNRETFTPFPVPEECKHLIVRSSRTYRKKTETLPSDTIVHPYGASITEEKKNTLYRCSEQNLKWVNLQGGTIFVLKKNLPPMNPLTIFGHQ